MDGWMHLAFTCFCICRTEASKDGRFQGQQPAPPLPRLAQDLTEVLTATMKGAFEFYNRGFSCQAFVRDLGHAARLCRGLG